MIDYMKAYVVQKGLGYIIADVNDIGYKMLVSQNTSYELDIDKQYIIYTHLIVKEDGLTLIGFRSITEKEMFEILISVSKVGAKIALSILSTYTPNQIGKFIKSGDIVSMSKVSGLGKKTAERLILELKDKVDLFASEDIQPIKSNKKVENDIMKEAIDALLMLGFSNKEAVSAVEFSYSDDKNVQSVIKDALSYLKK